MLTFLTLYTFKAETNKQQKGFFYYFLFCYQAFFFLNIFHPPVSAVQANTNFVERVY